MQCPFWPFKKGRGSGNLQNNGIYLTNNDVQGNVVSRDDLVNELQKKVEQLQAAANNAKQELQVFTICEPIK